MFRLSRPSAIRTDERVSFREFRAAFRNRAVLLVSVAGFCSYVLYIFPNSWMPTYAAAQLSLTLEQAGAVTALLPAVGVVARPAGGWVSDRLGYRRRAVVIASLALALPAFVVISRAISVLLFAGVMLVGFSLQFGMGVYYVYARELSAPEVAATSLTIFTTASFVGTLVAPPRRVAGRAALLGTHVPSLRRHRTGRRRTRGPDAGLDPGSGRVTAYGCRRPRCG